MPAEVRTWQEDEEPLRLVADFIKERGVATQPIGFEETNRYFIQDRLQQQLPGTRIVSANPVVRALRMIKTPAELALMQAAADVTVAAFRAIQPRIIEGMTPQVIGQLYTDAVTGMGGTTDGGLFLLGEAAAYPHGSGKPQHVRKGEVVLLDCGCDVHGYQSDISRTFVYGADPSAEQRKVWEQMRRGQDIAMAAAKVGAPAGSVDDAVRSAYESWGYGPGYKLPGTPHRTGHGIGMEGHEPVNLVHGETTPLAPGMCFSNEPGIYLPGKFGIRLEDCFYMTRGRAEMVHGAAAVDRPAVRLGLRRGRRPVRRRMRRLDVGRLLRIEIAFPSRDTAQATALPTTLVADRPMSRKWSTARISSSPASGMWNAISVAAMMTRLARGTPAMPFDVIIRASSIVISWPMRQVDAIGLGDENRREGHVHHRAVEIERIAERQDEAGDPRRHTEAVERLQGARKAASHRCGRESEDDRVADVADEMPGTVPDNQESSSDQQAPEDGEAKIEAADETSRRSR